MQVHDWEPLGCMSSFATELDRQSPHFGVNLQSAGRMGTVSATNYTEGTNSKEPHHVNESNYKLFNKEGELKPFLDSNLQGAPVCRQAASSAGRCSVPCPASGISIPFEFLRQLPGLALLPMGRVSASQQRFREQLRVKTLTPPGEPAAVLPETS